MWEGTHVATRLPTQDLERARVFYRDVLGLEPKEERPGGLLYELGDTEFALYESAGQATGEFTQMCVYVKDIEALVETLRERGAEVDGIAEIAGNYPSKGSGERAAWLRDSEGNLIGIAELVP
jgi:catechol 2,3-dioxygenase-like lactoylglutathione lyase family enzyme